MRYSGEARFNFSGDKQKAMLLIPQARTLMGILLNDAQFNSLEQARRQYTLKDGIIIEIVKLFDMKQINIHVPVIKPVSESVTKKTIRIPHLFLKSESGNTFEVSYDDTGKYTGLSSPITLDEIKKKYKSATNGGAWTNGSTIVTWGGIDIGEIDNIYVNGNIAVSHKKLSDDGDVIAACFVNGQLKVAHSKQNDEGIYTVTVIDYSGGQSTLFTLNNLAFVNSAAFDVNGVLNLSGRETVEGFSISAKAVVYADEGLVSEGYTNGTNILTPDPSSSESSYYGNNNVSSFEPISVAYNGQIYSIESSFEDNYHQLFYPPSLNWDVLSETTQISNISDLSETYTTMDHTWRQEEFVGETKIGATYSEYHATGGQVFAIAAKENIIVVQISRSTADRFGEAGTASTDNQYFLFIDGTTINLSEDSIDGSLPNYYEFGDGETPWYRARVVNFPYYKDIKGGAFSSVVALKFPSYAPLNNLEYKNIHVSQSGQVTEINDFGTDPMEVIVAWQEIEIN
jgi:hypothetical protein